MPRRENTTRIIRSLRSGQITIPAEFRKRLGMTDEGLLEVTLADGELRIRPVRMVEEREGRPWLRALYDEFAPVREEIGEAGISETEVNEDSTRRFAQCASGMPRVVFNTVVHVRSLINPIGRYSSDERCPSVFGRRTY